MPLQYHLNAVANLLPTVAILEVRSHEEYSVTPYQIKSAEGGTRTHTSCRTLDFESSASASSATSALSLREGNDDRAAGSRQVSSLAIAELGRFF